MCTNTHAVQCTRPSPPLLGILQLAKYCDQLLRKSSKGVGEQEVEDRLEEVVQFLSSFSLLPL